MRWTIPLRRAILFTSASIILAVALWYLNTDGISIGYAHTQLRLQTWRQAWRHWWAELPENVSLYRGTVDCVSPIGAISPTVNDGCASINATKIPSFSHRHGRTCSTPFEPAFGCGEATAANLSRCADRLTRLGPYGYTDTGTGHPWPIKNLAAYQQACVGERYGARKKAGSLYRPSRTAIVLRAWDGFEWTDDDLFNVRAMFAELSVSTGAKYELFVLLHVKNETQDPDVTRLVPHELVDMTEAWTYADAEAAYPRVGAYDVYYHTFMSLQLFAQRHPEFDFIWNWEMDVRYTGDYGHLFSSLEEWAGNQSLSSLPSTNHRFYIPSYYGSYEDFARNVASDDRSSKHGAMSESRLSDCRHSEYGGANCWGSHDETHLITLFPTFNVSGTLWPHKDYIIDQSAAHTRTDTRYGTVGTNMRLSRKLLTIMHEENLAGRAMMSEMWPTTMADRNSLKSVYVPHPVFTEREWTAEELQRTFNAGLDGSVGGSIGTVINQEQNFVGTTWFWNQPFALKLYSAWLGRSTDGPGSTKWEREHGLMCLPPMLLHPIKADRLRALN